VVIPRPQRSRRSCAKCPARRSCRTKWLDDRRRGPPARADLLGALDAGENIGLVSTLAQPNLTALSGETAEFLAGGEFPIPLSQGLGATSIEYKKYGVSLAYTPTVLANGRISLRVRPEVSELSSEGAITLNTFTIPALTVRRTETTVELGSGQSFMIAGLLKNYSQNAIKKMPGAGDLPILGSLFRSTNYQKGETELVIVVTPYLVNPVNANDIKLPTDGFSAPTICSACWATWKRRRSRRQAPRSPERRAGSRRNAPAVGAPPQPVPDRKARQARARAPRRRRSFRARLQSQVREVMTMTPWVPIRDEDRRRRDRPLAGPDALAGCGGIATNRSLDSIHQPVVERTNYTLDVTTGPGGLSYPEQRRLTGWFEAMAALRRSHRDRRSAAKRGDPRGRRALSPAAMACC
jgi:hypothetical protein